MSELTVRLDYVQFAMLIDELEYLTEREFHTYSREEVEREIQIIKKVKLMLDKAVSDKRFMPVKDTDL